MTPQELVQSLYDAFSRGDIRFILDHIAPNCRWTAPGTGIPNAGVYTGPAGVAEFFQRCGEYGWWEARGFFLGRR